MEGKVAVLGSSDFVMPYSTLGLDTFPVESGDRQEIEHAAKDILSRRYALVLMAENIAPTAEPVFEPTQTQATPCVLIVPFTKESTGYATESLGRLIKLATGINILAD